MKTGIVCLIIVIVTVYFFIKRRNSDRSKIIAEKTPNNQKSDPKKEAPAKPKVNRTDVYNEVKAWFSIILLAFLVALIGFWLFKGVYGFLKERPVSGSGQAEASSQPRNRATSFEWVVDDSQTRIVDLCNQYEDTLYFGPDVRFNFLNSTVPYCVQNGDGLEICGGKGEDLAFKLPKNSFGNRTLMFKAKEDTTGTLALYIWVKRYN